MNLVDHFNRVIKSLNDHNVEYILIGGYAVILHGLPRTTLDMDLILKMTEKNINQFRTALRAIYDDDDIEEINYSELKNYAVIRYGTADNFNIDVMAGIGQIASYENIDFEEIEFEGIKIKTATPEALYQLKSNSIRPADQSDALFLKELLERKGKK